MKMAETNGRKPHHYARQAGFPLAISPMAHIFLLDETPNSGA
jgi:hypothetical protein